MAKQTLYDLVWNELYGNAYEELIAKRKNKAHQDVFMAVKRGRLIKKACEYTSCGDPKTHAHHPDYSNTLDVIWLCYKHHKAIHKYVGALA